ncbi:MAG: beta-ketoacyl-ACP synthase II [Bacteroidales bacterium]
MEIKRVVVTGLGTVNPLGNSIAEYWEGLKSGKSGAALITKFDASQYRTQFACEVKGFAPEDYIEDRKEVRKMDLFTQYAMASTAQAVEDAKLNLEKLDLTRCGVIWGTGIGGLETFQSEVLNLDVAKPRLSPFFIPKMIINIAGGLISMKYGFMGPSFSTVTACASSNNAMIEALNYIRLGKADLFITGGAEAAINPVGVGGFNAMHALSTRNDDPKTASRPFDKDRDGFVIGEGAATLILEEYEHAVARGANIYGEVLGSGLSSDAYHMTAPHPDGIGVELVINSAIKDAGIKHEDIDYINVHGTSTGLGDVAESNAIKKVFGEHAYNLNISSTKSMTGHLLGGAGAVEAIATLLALRDGVVPPTINHFTDDDDIDNKLNFTFNTAQKRDMKYAMSNTFGFGGHNSTVILKRFE